MSARSCMSPAHSACRCAKSIPTAPAHSQRRAGGWPRPTRSTTLAAFAAFTAGEEPLPQKGPQQQELAEMVSRLGQLKDQRHSESCRAKQAEGKLVRASLKTMLDFLEEQIVAVQQAIDA